MAETLTPKQDALLRQYVVRMHLAGLGQVAAGWDRYVRARLDVFPVNQRLESMRRTVVAVENRRDT